AGEARGGAQSSLGAVQNGQPISQPERAAAMWPVICAFYVHFPPNCVLPFEETCSAALPGGTRNDRSQPPCVPAPSAIIRRLGDLRNLRGMRARPIRWRPKPVVPETVETCGVAPGSIARFG